MNAVGATTVEAPRRRSLRALIRKRRERERSVSFPELVWVHFLRQQELERGDHRPYEGPAEDRYRAFEDRFEAKHGEIVSQYWCTNEASGVALTVKRRPLLLADTVQLHWATDWSTKDKPKLMKLLFDCETLAVRVQEVLRDTSRRVAIQSLFNVISFLLGFAETKQAENDRSVAEVDRAIRTRLSKIETYYRNAAVRSGQIVYVGGMLLGMTLLIPLAITAAVVVGRHPNDPSILGIGLICFCAGAVGALISVMSRLSSGTVRVDWEFGKDTLRTLGALRPFVGAVFGLVTFIALRSGVIADLSNRQGRSYYYIVFAFAAGFSERFAQDMLLGSTVETVTRKPKQGDSDGQTAEAQAPKPTASS